MRGDPFSPCAGALLVAALATVGCSGGGQPDADADVDGDADTDADVDADADVDVDADVDADAGADADVDADGDDGGLVEGAFFVAPDGDDEGPGSLEEPWRTVGHAARTLAAGETAYVRAGTYRERVRVTVSGAPGAPVTIAAYPGERATIDGDGVEIPDDWGGLLHVADQEHVRLVGLRVENAGPSDTHAGILVERSSFVVVERCSTRNSSSSGIGVWRSSDVVIDSNDIELACNDGSQECLTVSATTRFQVSRNHVHDGGPGSQGGEGIDVKESCSDGAVFGNVVTRINRLGIYVDAWAGHCHDIEVYANLVFDCAGFGFAVATENGGLLEDVRLFDNVAWGNEHGGFAVAGWGVEGEAHAMARIALVNNTAWGNGGTDGWGPGIWLDNPEAEDVLLRNNLLSENGHAQIEVASEPDGLTVDHNLLFGAPGPDDFPGSVLDDPLLADPDAADFHLLPGSPAVDAGSDVDAPDADFDGVGRPQGAGFDIGAFELSP